MAKKDRKIYAHKIILKWLDHSHEDIEIENVIDESYVLRTQFIDKDQFYLELYIVDGSVMIIPKYNRMMIEITGSKDVTEEFKKYLQDSE